MKIAGCTGSYFPIRPGVQAAGIDKDTKYMFKPKRIIGVVAFDGLAIIALAVYLFLNFTSINLNKSIVLLVLAGIVMLTVIGTLIYLTRSLAPKKTEDENNTPQNPWEVSSLL